MLETVDAIIANIPRKFHHQVELIVFNADLSPDKHLAVGDLAKRHAALIQSGFLSILTNPGWHPELASRVSLLEKPTSTWGGKFWEAKLTLDATYLMRYGAQRGEYYLHVEDDFLAADGFYTRLVEWFDRNYADRNDWGMLSAYAPYSFYDGQEYPLENFIAASGMLFRSPELLKLVDAIRLRFEEQPFDLLIRHLFQEEHRSVFVCSPSLFQNLGVISTWEGKVGLTRSPTFEESRMSRVAQRFAQLGDIIRYRRRATPFSIRVFIRDWLLLPAGDRISDVALSLRRSLASYWGPGSAGSDTAVAENSDQARERRRRDREQDISRFQWRA